MTARTTSHSIYEIDQLTGIAAGSAQVYDPVSMKDPLDVLVQPTPFPNSRAAGDVLVWIRDRWPVLQAPVTLWIVVESRIPWPFPSPPPVRLVILARFTDPQAAVEFKLCFSDRLAELEG